MKQSFIKQFMSHRSDGNRNSPKRQNNDQCKRQRRTSTRRNAASADTDATQQHTYFIQQIPSENSFHLILTLTSVVNFHHPNGAIVNAANESCLGGGGVDGAISAAGGRKLFRDRLALPVIQNEDYSISDEVRCPVGEAKITGPESYGTLGVPFVIHAVGPAYGAYRTFEEGDELLREAYVDSLKRAEEKNVSTVAFSLLSSGVFRGRRSLIDVLRIGMEAIIDGAEEGGQSNNKNKDDDDDDDELSFGGYKELEEVHMCAFSSREMECLVAIAEGKSLEKVG